MKITGIKCDNINCDYEDNTVIVEQYESYLNKPCPKCKSNLLTEADLRTVKVLMAVMDNPIVKCIDKIGKLFGDKEETIEIDMNGSGNFKIKK